MKRLKKGQGVAWLVVLLACIVGFGYLAWNIVTATVSGKDDFDIRLGLDLAGGVSITYQVVGDTPSSEDLNDTVTKLQKRIENELGSDSSTTEASVYPVGDDRITVEIPGVSMTNFMRAAINEKRKYEGKEPMPAGEFLKLMREKRAIVELDSKLANRSVNEGFSGGEKKRNEIFQMAMLEPKLAILDETDSGLDVDAMRIVAEGVNKLHTPETSTIVITHYDRLLDMIKPDVVHVLYKGRIVKTAGPELAKEIQERGYDWIKSEVKSEE